MQKKLIFLLVAVVLLVISIKYFPYHCNCGPNATELVATSTLTASSTPIQLGENTIYVDIADNGELRERGLSGRTSLSKDSGMLFVFEEPGFYGFWMKDMNFSLDIVWINEDKKVIDLSEGLAPETYPDIFYPQEEVKYAIELPSGYIELHKVKIGDKLVTSS